MATSEIEKQRVRLELHPVGDRELWVIDGDDKSWSIPLFLDWKVERVSNEEYAFIYCALAPYPVQSMAMQARLNPFSVLEAQDRWLLPKEAAIRLLRKAPGITPRYYYRWPDAHFAPIPTASPLRIDRDLGNQAGSWDFEQFLQYVGRQHSVPMVMLRVVWKAICREAPVWMMESRRPLDLGFCRLVAFPFRANWKDIVRAKIGGRKLAGLFRLPQGLRRRALDDAEVPEALCSPHNIGMLRASQNDSGRRLIYTLEAIPNDRFERAINIVEGKRVSCGTTSYVANFEQTVERQYDIILDALQNYVRKITAPFARVYESSATGNLKFVPTTRPEKLRGVDPRHIPVDIVAPDSPFSVLGEQKHASRVSRKTEVLPEVPGVLPAIEDVRQCDGTGGDRLQLLDAGQGGAERGDVLPSRTPAAGDSPGLAAGAERVNEPETNDERDDTRACSDSGASGSGPSPRPPPDDLARASEEAAQAGDGGGPAVPTAWAAGHQGQDSNPPGHR